MVSNKGNTNKPKFRTPKMRREACAALCDHLANGLSLDCFPLMAKSTIYDYLKNYPDEFDAELIDEAKRKGRVMFEGVGIAAMQGAVPNFNATAWVFGMKNRYGWRDQPELPPESPPQINITLAPPEQADEEPDE